MLHPLFLDADPTAVWPYVAVVPMVIGAAALLAPRRQPAADKVWDLSGAIYLLAAAALVFVVPPLVAVLLAATAVYLSLPRPQPFPLLLRAVTGGAAVLSVLALLISWGPFTPETVLFFCFAGLAILFGGLLVTQHDPARAALSFAVVVLSTCGMFLLQAAPFLMAATVIIYAGAIIVTFLFVLMLAQQHGLSSADYRSREAMLSTVAGFVLLGTLLYVLAANYNTRPIDAVLAKIDEARAAKPSKLGEVFAEDSFRKELRDAVHRSRPDLVDQTMKEFENNREGAENERLGLFLAHLKSIRLTTGDLQPGTHLPAPPAEPGKQPEPPTPIVMSPFSGTPANKPLAKAPPRGDDGHAPLPAANVAALGKTLFTDYLLSVELGGTLLLVATIGAIAITGRRGERTV